MGKLLKLNELSKLEVQSLLPSDDVAGRLALYFQNFSDQTRIKILTCLSVMDMCVSGVMSGTQSVADAARELLEEVLAVASGKPSKAERCGYNNSMNIYVTGPVI